jgi:gamma-D-glutamyl-L-lysine dipeptidyl-peptidase
MKMVKQTISSWQEFALTYLNTPYLWGGKSPFGIDCSGFTQQVFRFKGINIPRDAYQQEELGILIEFDDVQEGDVAFFSNDKGKITHVGIILNDKQIIHASSWVRIDQLKYDGIYTSDTSEKTHQLASIKRI